LNPQIKEQTVEHRDTYNHLVEGAKPLQEQLEHSSTSTAIRFLLDYARRHTLHTEAAWRLSSRVERELEAAAEYRPPGGWASLAGLLAGTGRLNAKRDKFILQPSAPFGGLSDREILIELAEAMTRKLVPPATAASIFIALGIHPAWGLRLAWEIQNAGRGEAMAANPPMEELLSAEGLEPARKAVFVFIALVVGILQKLEHQKSYAIDLFAAVLDDAVRFARSVGECHAEVTTDDLPCFLSDDSSVNRRVIQVLARDLLDDVFIPSGIVRDVGDGRFAVLSEGLDDVRVDEMDREQREEWMGAFLEPDGMPSCNSPVRG
jgi:hypothetical protein